jgi:hypothetical protein
VFVQDEHQILRVDHVTPGGPAERSASPSRGGRATGCESGWNRLPYLSRTNVGVSPLDHTPLLPLSFSLSTPQGSKHAEDASCAQTLGVSLALSKNAVLSPRLSCLPPFFHSPSIPGGMVKQGDELYAVAGQQVHGLTIGQLATRVSVHVHMHALTYACTHICMHSHMG